LYGLGVSIVGLAYHLGTEKPLSPTHEEMALGYCVSSIPLGSLSTPLHKLSEFVTDCVKVDSARKGIMVVRAARAISAGDEVRLR